MVPSAVDYSNLVLERSSRTPNYPTLSIFFSWKLQKKKEEDLGAHAWSGTHCRLVTVQARTSQKLLESILSKAALEREVANT